MRNRFDENEKLAGDVLDIIGQSKSPIIISDLIGTLCGSVRCSWTPRPISNRRWSLTGTVIDFADELKDYGFFVRYRTFGSGICMYASLSNFNQVIDQRHHKSVPVSAW